MNYSSLACLHKEIQMSNVWNIFGQHLIQCIRVVQRRFALSIKLLGNQLRYRDGKIYDFEMLAVRRPRVTAPGIYFVV